MLRSFPGTLKLRSSRAGGGWRAFACVALALAALSALPPGDACAKRLIQKDVLWLNSLRVGGSSLGTLASGTRLDTLYTPVVATAGVDTTMPINIQDLSTPPWWQRKPVKSAHADPGNSPDTVVTDTVLVGRFVVWADTTQLSGGWVTSATISVDALTPTGVRIDTVTAFQGVLVDSTSYGTMGTAKNSLAFPLFIYVDPRSDALATQYGTLSASDPTKVGGMMGHAQIRLRFTHTGVTQGKVRAAIQYYVDN